jgi:hypothetical protein
VALEPFVGHQTLEPSTGHQIGVFLHLLPFPSLQKANLNNLRLFFSEHNFQFEFWKNSFLQLFVGGKEWLVLVDGGNKENILNDCGTFERMEGSRDGFGSLKS